MEYEDEQESQDRLISSVPGHLSSFTSANATENGYDELYEEDRVVMNPLRPIPPSRTLKETLVERERQKRIETERARLKRQFALSHVGSGAGDGGDEVYVTYGSVAGTVGGGSSVGAAGATEVENDDDEDNGDINDDDDINKMNQKVSQRRNHEGGKGTEWKEEDSSEKLGYVMERFLSEQGPVAADDDLKPSAQIDPSGIVMERFLSEPVVLTNIEIEESNNIDNQAMNISDLPFNSGNINVLPTLDSIINDTNQEIYPADDATQVYSELGVVEHHDLSLDYMTMNPHAELELGTEHDLNRLTENRIHLLNSISATDENLQEQGAFPLNSALLTSHPPEPIRRLTELEIQEMEAIDEASIGNAPPSDRSEREDILSELEDIVGSFVHPSIHMEPPGGFSVNTHTTESISNTSAGGNRSREHQSPLHPEDSNSIDGIETASVSSHLEISVGSSGDAVSVTANPPSVIAPEVTSPLQRDILHSVESAVSDIDEPLQPIIDDEHDSLSNENSNEGGFDQQMNAWLTATPPRILVERKNSEDCEMRHTASVPDSLHVALDDLEFEKYDDERLLSFRNDETYQEHPNNSSWHQVGPIISLSPLQTTGSVEHFNENIKAIEQEPPIPNINSLEEETVVAKVNEVLHRDSHLFENKILNEEVISSSERCPLDKSEKPSTTTSKAKNVASNPVQSKTANSQEECDDLSMFSKTSVLARAFPDRFFVLLVTLGVEIPILFIITGGSDNLCNLFGRKRYQLLLAFLPLVNAISGNCVLQSLDVSVATVTNHNLTIDKMSHWFLAEMGSVVCLALIMSILIGICAYLSSGSDIPFAVSIFTAQFISIMSAGFIGTLSPFFFRYMNFDFGKWGRLLETAIQDVVGAFAMIIVSYRILLYFGPYDMIPSDMCNTII